MVSSIIEGTIVLVALFLILNNANAFDKAAQAVGSVYSSAVKTLQGR